MGIILSTRAILWGAEGVDEIMQTLESKIEYLTAMIQDIEGASLPAGIRRGKKRKRQDDGQLWVAEARQLLKEAELVLKVVGKGRNFIKCAKMIRIVCKTVEALAVLEKKGDILFSSRCAYGRLGPSCGLVIPVNELFGQSAATNLEKLQFLLRDSKIGRIAIHGIEGIGKTILMKHLHNRVLKWVERFDYVFWVSFPEQFSIKYLQDAVAAAVDCDLSGIADLKVRAEKLSHMLAHLGRFVLFLDAVPEEARFSLEEVGIPVPTDGIACKLVLTTSSPFICEMLDCVNQVKLGPLAEEEAFQLFMYKAGIHEESVSKVVEIARLLAKQCSGVPSKIVERATSMCGIDDICEWNYALSESKNVTMSKRKLSSMKLSRLAKKLKYDILVHSYLMNVD